MTATSPPHAARPRGLLRTAWVLPLLLAAAGTAAPTAPAAAQVPSLPRVDSLLAAGAYDQARADLDRWWSAREEFDVPGSDRARALVLRARLAPSMEQAEADYLAVVLGYPTSEHAPEALLRLGQGLLAAGEPERAAAYLQRLVADYPGQPQRNQGLLWLARASTAARRPAVACDAARQGLRDARDSDLLAMLRAEAAAACAMGADAAVAAGPEDERAGAAGQASGQPQPQPDRRPPSGGAGATAEDGGYAAQTGAFRYAEGARDLVERLRTRGYDARTVRVPGNTLLRVRVGRLGTAQEAASLVARLKGDGFDAYVVGDVRQERAP